MIDELYCKEMSHNESRGVGGDSHAALPVSGTTPEVFRPYLSRFFL